MDPDQSQQLKASPFKSLLKVKRPALDTFKAEFVTNLITGWQSKALKVRGQRSGMLQPAVCYSVSSESVP